MPIAKVKCKECNTNMCDTRSQQGHYIYNCPYCERKVVEYNELVILK